MPGKKISPNQQNIEATLNSRQKMLPNSTNELDANQVSAPAAIDPESNALVTSDKTNRVFESASGTLVVETTKEVYVNTYETVNQQKFVTITGGGGPGSQGATGATGLRGATGATGAPGLTGASGPIGPTGADGATGVSGYSGAAGNPGATGTTGNTGATGPAGTNGATGVSGYSGEAGGVTQLIAGTNITLTPINGLGVVTINATGGGGGGGDGATGATGATGVSGYSGANGTIGVDGATGATGVSGYSGTDGTIGATGFSGFSGLAGIGGVCTLNSLSGALTLSAGTNISIGSTGNTLTICSTGSGGSPGGASRQFQYNNAGSFAGASGLTYCSTTGAVGMSLIRPESNASLTINTIYGPSSWVAVFGDFSSGSNREKGTVLTYDNDGNVYVVGDETGNATGFIVKYDPYGNVLWQKSAATPVAFYDARAAGVAVDSSNNVYAAFYARYGAPPTLTPRYFTIVKFDSAGTVLWQKDITDATLNVSATDIKIDSADNLIVTGAIDTVGTLVMKINSSGSIVWQNTVDCFTDIALYANINLDSSNNIYLTSANAATSMAVVKLNSSGAVQWQQALTHTTNINIGAVDIDSAGNIILAGSYVDAVLSSQQNTYVVKLDSSGALVWQNNYKTSGGNSFYASGVVIDSSNNIYVNGTQDGSNSELYIIKLDSAGSILWQRSFGSPTYEYTWTYSTIGTIGLNNNNQYVITGYTDLSGTQSDAVIAQLPTDGSLTGTYGSWTYSSVTYTTDTALFTVDTGTTYSETPGTTTDSTGTLTITTTTNANLLTSIVGGSSTYKFDSIAGVFCLPNYSLPKSDGSAGYALTTCGNGQTIWAQPTPSLNNNGSVAIRKVGPAAYGCSSTITGVGNIAIGNCTLTDFCNNYGGSSVAIGEGTLRYTTCGTNNIALGRSAMERNTTGADNIAIGIGSLNGGYGTGAGQTFSISIGAYAMRCGAAGDRNIAIGCRAMACATSGNNNIAIGSSALCLNTTGYGNTVVGAYGLTVNQIGINNTAIGRFAGCTLTGGNNNTFLGHNAVGQTATSCNTITLGNNSITCIRAQVTTISSLSDARDKTEVKNIPLGLEFVLNLRPVKFTWNMRDGAKVGIEDSGFIAQEVASIEDKYDVASWLDMVGRENPDKLEIKPAKLIPILVKAIQELHDKHLVLESEYNLLVNKIKLLQEKLDKL